MVMQVLISSSLAKEDVIQNDEARRQQEVGDWDWRSQAKQ
jgi:hypothetical protein